MTATDLKRPDRARPLMMVCPNKHKVLEWLRPLEWYEVNHERNSESRSVQRGGFNSSP